MKENASLVFFSESDHIGITGYKCTVTKKENFTQDKLILKYCFKNYLFYEDELKPHSLHKIQFNMSCDNRFSVKPPTSGG